jgi:hypothetical protein
VTVADVRLDHLALAREYAAAPELWPVAPRFTPSGRWYHRIAEADDHEVWLLTWLPGQATDLHDHGGSAGAFHVYSGTLIEDVHSGGGPDSRLTAQEPGRLTARELDEGDVPAGRLTARELGEGAGRRFGSHHIHRIANRSSRPAISIHVYGPALTTMTRYRIGPAGLAVVAVEQAGVQW